MLLHPLAVDRPIPANIRPTLARRFAWCLIFGIMCSLLRLLMYTSSLSTNTTCQFCEGGIPTWFLLNLPPRGNPDSAAL
ncbi:hypothetical protein BJ912DRAFT_974831 [Pholiota molesta]|nr:hypothetical protein BJ912DRAFT_974831 [Pholiota molesta]